MSSPGPASVTSPASASTQSTTTCLQQPPSSSASPSSPPIPLYFYRIRKPRDYQCFDDYSPARDGQLWADLVVRNDCVEPLVQQLGVEEDRDAVCGISLWSNPTPLRRLCQGRDWQLLSCPQHIISSNADLVVRQDVDAGEHYVFGPFTTMPRRQFDALLGKLQQRFEPIDITCVGEQHVNDTAEDEALTRKLSNTRHLVHLSLQHELQAELSRPDSDIDVQRCLILDYHRRQLATLADRIRDSTARVCLFTRHHLVTACRHFVQHMLNSYDDPMLIILLDSYTDQLITASITQICRRHPFLFPGAESVSKKEIEEWMDDDDEWSVQHVVMARKCASRGMVFRSLEEFVMELSEAEEEWEHETASSDCDESWDQADRAS